MKPAKGGLLAFALLTFLPLAAAAQGVEIAWRTAPPAPSENRPVPEFYRAGDPLPWPLFDPVPFRPSLEVPDSPEERERRLASLSRYALLTEIRGRSVLDTIAGVPNDVLDGVASVLRPPPSREDCVSIRPSEEGSLMSRIFTGSIHEASSRPFDDLAAQLIVREQKYFARFRDSGLSTVGVEDGVEDIDAEALKSDQRKIMFDAVRKLYFGRLGSRADERIRDESLDVSRWHAVDYAVAPTLIAGYLYVRGWEKKVDVLGLRCGFQLEPLRRILERFEGSHNDLVSAASLELGLGDFPVKVIVSLGIEDGDPLLDFVGIGTSVGKAKQVISQFLGDSDE